VKKSIVSLSLLKLQGKIIVYESALDELTTAIKIKNAHLSLQ